MPLDDHQPAFSTASTTTGARETPPFADDLRAATATAGADDAAPLLAVLARHGLPSRFAVPSAGGGYRYEAPWRDALELLALIGGIDLSTARLFEGHVNALQLVALYGTPAQQAEILRLVSGGGFLGVWGAEGREPARLTRDDAGRLVLTGSKRYASGAGLLSAALVPVNDETGGRQLLLLPVTEPGRADLSSWNHRGMRRSASGTYDFEGLPVAAERLLGGPGDYAREPFFVGGIWRCAAAQLGAIEAIVGAMARELKASGRDAHPLQGARLGTAILKARSARLFVEDAAERIETCPHGADHAGLTRDVALSAYARLAVETAAMDVIDLAERALGLSSFAIGHPAEALTRDLAVYIRQANPDAVLLEHGRTLALDYAS